MSAIHDKCLTAPESPSARAAKNRVFAAQAVISHLTRFLIKPYENQCHKNRGNVIDYPKAR